MEFFASHRPVVLPQQRTDSQHTSSSLSEIRLIVERHLFYTFLLNIASEVSGARLQIIGSNHHLSTALQHLSAHIIHVWTSYLSRTSHHDIIGRIRTIATGAMSAEKIIPAIAINQIGSFTVDGDIDGFVAFYALTRLRVEFYQTDKSEISTITEPESAGSRVEQQARINRITVFIIQGRSHHHRFGIFEIRRFRVETFVPHRQDITAMTAAQSTTRSTVGYKITVAYLQYIRSRSSAGTNSTTLPGPAILRPESTFTRTKGIILSITQGNGRRIMNKRFAHLGFCLVSRRRQQGNQSSDIKFLLSSNRAKISEKYIVLFHNFLYRLHYFT